MTPIESAARAVEEQLIGHVDPGSHDMSEYGIAQMVVKTVLAAIREPSEAMIDHGFADMGVARCDVSTIYTAMIDAMLEKP
ncbi:MAG: hypothetical protein V4523_07915 [Pseudomonadota bacterium]